MPGTSAMQWHRHGVYWASVLHTRHTVYGVLRVMRMALTVACFSQAGLATEHTILRVTRWIDAFWRGVRLGTRMAPRMYMGMESC